MTATDSVNDFLLAGGIPACKFPEIGTTVKGTITASEVAQQTDYATGVPKTWDNGEPMMQVIVTLQTDDRDASVDGDSGLRKLYVRGQMLHAVREALKQAQAKLEVGGTLAVQYASDKPSEKRGFNPAKQYVAQYKPPAPGQAVNDLLNGTQAEPAAAAPAPADLI